MVVSGSNMSGKSTLLRSVGTAVVMAQMGARVSARRFAMEPLIVGASIATHDSLQEGSSRFYAEISRLRQILAMTEGEVPVLFLLDEMLSGTNSHDRRLGAGAVVRRLVEGGALGIVTTHDLALSQIATDLGARATNVHFRDHLEGDRIAFDYQMHPGVVERGNALALMRSIGLEV
jgi:DNA mismatch repair ATPase MutS